MKSSQYSCNEQYHNNPLGHAYTRHTLYLCKEVKWQVVDNIKDIRVEEVAKPSIESNQVLVEVADVGICGSNIGIYHVGLGTTPHPITNDASNAILDREFSGTFVDVGAE